MIFQKTTLPNGLRVVIAPMPSMESATVQILVGAGTRDEEARVNGIAHFLEHMVFKGTEKYPSSQIISSAIDGIGGEINANTSKERTAYYIKAWERYLTLGFDILSDFIRAPLLDEEEIAREKGVIIEEIAMYEDLPMQKVPFYFEELLYKDDPLGWDIVGTRQTVEATAKNDFLQFREKFYVPENMVLTVAGKFNTKEVLALAQEYFGNLGNSTPHFAESDSATRGKQESVHEVMHSNRYPKTDIRLNPSGKPEIRVVVRKTEQAHLILGVRGNPLGHEDRYNEAVLAAILGGGMSSRLWTEIRERRGLAYYVRSEIEHYRDQGYMAVRAGVKLGKVDEVVKIILDEFGKTRAGDITFDELKKAKEYLKGRLALALEDTHSVSEFFGDQEITEGKIRTIEEVMAGIEAVNINSVQALAESFFTSERLNLAVVGPKEKGAKFQELFKL